jgi:hypothetical protein
MQVVPSAAEKTSTTETDLSRVESTTNEKGEEEGNQTTNFREALAHPLAKITLVSLALLFLMVVCGGGAASDQPWLAQAAPSSSAYFSAGSVSAGVISCGSSLSFGGFFSIGLISIGTFSVGIFSVGIFSIGFFSLGLASFGHYALGVWAWGIIVAYVKDGQGLEGALKLQVRLPFLADAAAAEESLDDIAEAGYAQGVCNYSSTFVSHVPVRTVKKTDKGDKKSVTGKEDTHKNATILNPLPPEILLDDKGKSGVKLAEFEEKHGTHAGVLVKKLYTRHALVDPGKHASKPYLFTTQDTWWPLRPSRDASGEQMVKELADLLRSSKSAKFEDPFFPADDTSLFADPTTAAAKSSAQQQTFRKDQDPFLAGVTGIEWRRPAEFGDVSQKVVTWSGREGEGGGVDPDDVAQGRLGNCYLLAALASCALGQSDVLIKDLCIEDHQDVGLYGES